MTTEVLPEFTKWSGSEDDEGHSEYIIEFKVRADITDGPFNVRNTPNLPLPGSFWSYKNDIDPNATCRRRAKMTPMQKEDEATDLWRVEFFYSTKPFKRCQDFTFENPLTEPQKISGSWKNEKKEATTNRFGIPLRYSSHERMKGPKVEFEEGFPTVRIEQNVLNLELDILAIAMNTVNSVPMWGLPIRCVRLSGVSWSREYYGSCFPYYKRSLEFEINPDTFDRDVADEGHKVLYGRWEKPGVYRLLCIDGDLPDHKNPAHFVEFKYPSGNPGIVQLNGKGLPAGACIIWDECATARALSPRMTLCPEINTPMLNELTTTGSYTKYYISMWNNNVGASLYDGVAWLNVVSNIVPSPWQSFFIYKTGSLVTHTNRTWVAIADSRGAEPTVGSGTNVWWMNLGSSTTTGTNPDHAIDNKGIYNRCTTYNLGDYVVESAGNQVLTGSGTGRDYSGCDRTRPGFIKVEKYAEINLFTLGVPTVL